MLCQNFIFKFLLFSDVLPNDFFDGQPSPSVKGILKNAPKSILKNSTSKPQTPPDSKNQSASSNAPKEESLKQVVIEEGNKSSGLPAGDISFLDFHIILQLIFRHTKEPKS